MQIRGTAMGANLAPVYANIYVADLEDVYTTDYFQNALCWLEYIDNVFLVWTGSTTEL